jgi:hypothetical protein
VIDANKAAQCIGFAQAAAGWQQQLIFQQQLFAQDASIAPGATMKHGLA